jgi:hypothetical protein
MDIDSMHNKYYMFAYSMKERPTVIMDSMQKRYNDGGYGSTLFIFKIDGVSRIYVRFFP